MADRNSPATRGDLEDLEARLNERVEMLRSETNHSHNELMEAFRDGQTELLKAFYNYSQTSDERMGLAETETASFKKRLAILESRIKEVEKRLNMPPAA